MKELSIEEKAKRYDEAIKRAKECHTDGLSLHQPVKDVLEHIFPELKESEDERIRKELIELVEEIRSTTYYGRCCYKEIPFKSILAWLEKQKSSKAFIIERDKWYMCIKNMKMSDGSYAYIQGHLYKGDGRGCLQNEQGGWFGSWEKSGEKYFRLATNKELIEKQGKQKSIDNLTPQEAMDIAVAKCFDEQKPAWSEEDERIRHSLITDLSNASTNDEEVKNEINKDIAWLKSLKERVQPQPKQEWSEEDEAVINKAESWLDTLCDYLKDCSSECIPTVKEVISKLNSLKDRYTWKPSDEHYELEEFAKIVRDNLTGISKAVQKLFEAKYLQLTGNKMYGGFKD